jgi:hypothetical protein
VRGIAEAERIRVVRSKERNDIATANAEAVERPRIAMNGVQKVAGSDVSAAMPETGPVARGLEPLHQALDIQGIGKYHLLASYGLCRPAHRRQYHDGDWLDVHDPSLSQSLSQMAIAFASTSARLVPQA